MGDGRGPRAARGNGPKGPALSFPPKQLHNRGAGGPALSRRRRPFRPAPQGSLAAVSVTGWIAFWSLCSGAPTGTPLREARGALARAVLRTSGQTELLVASCGFRAGSRGLLRNSVAPGETEVANEYPPCFLLPVSSIGLQGQSVELLLEDSGHGLPPSCVQSRPGESEASLAFGSACPLCFPIPGADPRVSHPLKKPKEAPRWF